MTQRLNYEQRKKRKRATFRYRMLILAIAIVIVRFAWELVKQEQTIRKLEGEKAQQDAAIVEMKADITRLNREYDMRESDAYVEKVAREKLGMVKPGDYIILNEDHPEGILAEETTSQDSGESSTEGN